MRARVAGAAAPRLGPDDMPAGMGSAGPSGPHSVCWAPGSRSAVPVAGRKPSKTSAGAPDPPPGPCWHRGQAPLPAPWHRGARVSAAPRPFDLACAHRHLPAPICWWCREGIAARGAGCRSLPSRCPPKDYSSDDGRPPVDEPRHLRNGQVLPRRCPRGSPTSPRVSLRQLSGSPPSDPSGFSKWPMPGMGPPNHPAATRLRHADPCESNVRQDAHNDSTPLAAGHHTSPSAIVASRARLLTRILLPTLLAGIAPLLTRR